MTNDDQPPLDNPILSSSEDVLGRADVAHSFAKDLREVSAADGLVVGVLGAWGSGKSSFVNLMREEFQSEPQLTIIDFNPWMFSGAQQLVDVFFKEVAAELRLQSESRFGKIADGLDEYGDVLSPVALIPGVGGYFDRSIKALRSARQWWKKHSAKPLREKVADALAALDQPVVVVIDDIDRLTTEEIRDIFKLVRLTASFPNIIYLLAFDRKRVEAALDDANVPGRAYLEKIIQLSFDLPVISREVIRSQIFARLNPLLDGVAEVRFSTDRWPDVFFEVIEPLISNMRDVTRLALSARPTIKALGSEVEAVDLLALEALRVFKPELFEQLPTVRLILTEVRSYDRGDSTRQQAEIDKLLTAAGSDAELVRNLIRRIFPAAERYTRNNSYGASFSTIWKRDHRVAHLDFFNYYLERAAPSEIISFRRAEKAYTLLADQEALATYLMELRPEDLEDTISGLEAYEQSYPIEAVVPASIVLLNTIQRIPVRDRRGVFDFYRPDLIVARVVLRLIRRIEDEPARETAASSILGLLDSYSTQLEFLTLIGSTEGAGHKLVSQAFASEVESAFADRVAAARPPRAGEEWQLLRVYWWLLERQGDTYSPFRPETAEEARSLFKSARSVNQSQSFDSRAVRTEEVLAWESLIRVVGDEEGIRVARDLLHHADGESPLVLLVDKYLDGWRPSRD